MNQPDDSRSESNEPSRDYQAPAWDSWADTPDTYPGPTAGAEADLDSTQAWQLPEGFNDDPDDTQVVTAQQPLSREEVTAQVGSLIAERYRLEEPLIERHGVWTWRAFDEKLSRPVLVHVLTADDARTEAVLTAARRSAVATDSRFMRVLDAVSAGDQGPDGSGAYVICEYIDTMSLEEMLRQGPLSGLEAAWVVRELADALTPMHAQGRFHQHLNPDSVLISPTGNVKIVGFLIDAALAGETVERSGPGSEAWAAAEEADVHALGQLLYACLVTRWPTLEHSDQLHHGMPSAPADHQGWLTPRQVRGGVSPALDLICDQILHEVPRMGGTPMRSVSQIDQALSRALGTADASSDLEQRVRHPQQTSQAVTSTTAAQPALPIATPAPAAARPAAPAAARPAVPAAARPASQHQDGDQDEDSVQLTGGGPEHPRDRPTGQRHWLRILIGLVALALVVGLVANALRGGGKDEAEPQPTPTSTAPTAMPIAKVDDFDPDADGGNGEENPNDIAKAWDNNPKTAWTTLTYLNQAKLGGLKPGVGLVVDLGQEVDIASVKLTLQGSPTAVAILVPATKVTGSSPPMNSAKQWRQVASVAKAGTSVTLTPKAATSTRYLLIYLTSLPNVGGNKYRGAIAEISVLS